MSHFSKSADIPHTPKTLRRFRRLAMGIATILVFYVPLHAQYGGGGTMGTGGTGGTTATGSGAAGLYLLMHRSSSVTGCVQPANDGLRLVDDKSKRSFSVMPGGAALVPGQHVHLRGKIIKQQDGAEIFEAKKLVKNLGTCGAQSADTQGGQ